MISTKQQQQQPKKPQQNSKQKHFNNCLLESVKSKFKSALDNSTISETSTLDSKTKFKTKMSSMTADLHAAAAAVAAGKAAQTTALKPPMEAVVVNSIIYSKPSFCSIVVDLGGGFSLSGGGEMPMTKDKMPKLPNGCCANKIFTNEGGFPPTAATMNMKSSLATFASACLAGFTCPPQPLFPPPPPPPAMAAQPKDAQVYSLCTTMNGSIHHQISDLCDNLMAMAGFFGMAPNDVNHNNHYNHHNDDDDENDSDIEFAYDEGHYEDAFDEEDEDDEDDEEEETDDDDDQNDNDLDVEYNNYNDFGYDNYLGADKDIVDFTYDCSTENPSKLNCDKRKKVRFNTEPTVHVMHTWNYAYRAARKGQWEMYARDRERFRLRIQRASLLLNPILEREHRQKIYEKRFANESVEEPGLDEEKPTEIPSVEIKSEVTQQNAAEITNGGAMNEKKNESKNIYQKKKRKKRRFCKMGNKHYF